MKPIQIFLPEDIINEAKERAKDLGITFSEYLREIIITGVKYGLYLPGLEGPPELKLGLNEEAIKRIVEEIIKAIEEKEKTKKNILKKLLEWFR